MTIPTRLRTLFLLAMLVCGCAESATTESTLPSTKKITATITAKEKKSMTQKIELNGSQVAEITANGEIWIGGVKEGDITEEGEIRVGGDKEGDLTKDGEVWMAGEKVGEITGEGEVWRDGNEVGTVTNDGTIWIGSSREGRLKGGDARHAAVIVFYGFFNLDE